MLQPPKRKNLMMPPRAAELHEALLPVAVGADVLMFTHVAFGWLVGAHSSSLPRSSVPSGSRRIGMEVPSEVRTIPRLGVLMRPGWPSAPPSSAPAVPAPPKKRINKKKRDAALIVLDLIGETDPERRRKFIEGEPE